MRMKVSNYIAKLLVQNGITDVFMITGGGAGKKHRSWYSCIWRSGV